MDVSPYMHDVKQHDTKILENVNRVILGFIGGDVGEKCLDIGVPNQLKEVLETSFSRKIDSTSIDLDIEPLHGEYDTVFCFEVLEHVFNPLHMLLEIHKVLKQDGVLYLSTPKGKPYFLWWEHHFHEFHERELLAVFKRAGFEVVRREYFRVKPFYKYFGFRPLMRLLFERKCMVKLKKI